MSTMTLRGLDDALANTLKQLARQEGVSLNTLVLRLIREATGFDKRKRTTVYHDLDALAGTWTAEEEADFNGAIQPLETIDQEIWK